MDFVMTCNKKRAALATLGLISSLSANAIDPASVVSSGPIAVVPTIDIEVKHDDNLFITETNTDSSMITILRPSVQFVAERANDAYRVTFGIEDGDYANSSADNYTDYNLTAEAIIELNSRHRIDFNTGYLRGHEARGSTNSTTGDVPSEYTENNIGFVYRYGAEGAIANIELTGSFLDHSYDNFISINESRERENTRFGGTFFYRVAPKTSGLFEVRYEDIDYDLATSTLDNIETKYLLGVKWDATAKTSGTAKFGRMEKKYDSPARKGQGGASWEVAARWSPRTYSVFDLSATQEFEEASGNEDAVDSKLLSLSWMHSWNDRFSTTVALSRMDEEYSGISREDQTDSVTLAANYEIQRWMGVKLAYTGKERDSDLVGQSYDSKQVMLTLSLSF